jgi:hypothetical protein
MEANAGTGTGDPMKVLTLADWTGTVVETELFAQTCKSHGLAAVRSPLPGVTATVESFDNGRGFSLRLPRAGKPRQTRRHKTSRTPSCFAFRRQASGLRCPAAYDKIPGENRRTSEAHCRS